MDQRRCCDKTRRGLSCRFKSVLEHEGKMYCKKHYFIARSHDECSICLEKMTSNKVRLKCNHFFHKKCLAHCHKTECPLCRSIISSTKACEIFYESKVKPILLNLFDQPCRNQNKLMELYNELCEIRSLSKLHLLGVFVHYLKDTDLKDVDLALLLRQGNP